MPNAHRPPKYDSAMKRKNLHLPEHMIEYAREKADGKLAEGVRQCIQESMDDDSVKKD